MAKPGLHLIVPCVYCGKDYRQYRIDQRYCSKECWKTWFRGEKKSLVKTGETCICPICSKSFVKSTTSQKHCSPECTYKKRKAVLRNGKTKGWSKGIQYVKRNNCMQCGKEFYSPPCMKKRGGLAGQFCSNPCKGAYMCKNMHNYVNHKFKAGYRDDLPNMYFRSSWEANYARYLSLMKSQKMIKKWEHEKHSFEINVLGKLKHYLPDFKVYHNDGTSEFHEVKGYYDERSKSKIEAFIKQYPQLKLKVITKTEYREMYKKYKDMIMFWEKVTFKTVIKELDKLVNSEQC